MSYQVLARKWRPQQFGQLVGQEHVKSALTHALTQNRLHHAYLFTGTRGVGKTTIARIFAKSLNCEQGVTATPCGQCSTCREIDAGFYVDLLEIDAASRTKVEDTRDLLDNVQYAPTRGRYKVYLIDEVHMLSKHSFNALLKTLEEPPPHVKFLLATTDPQKLPITVLSRCLQFSLKALTQAQIKQHLGMVLAKEQIPAEEEALALLARAAKGSLRDSLSLTDQAIAQTGGQITLGAVREMLGYLEQSWAEILLQSVLNRDLPAMQRHLYQLLSSHPQCQSVLDDMLALLHLAALTQYQLNAAELAMTESAFVRAVAKSQSPEAIQLYYQLLLSGKKDLPYAPDPRTGLEMALLRAIAFVPATSASVEVATPSARMAALNAAGIPNTQISAPEQSVTPQMPANHRNAEITQPLAPEPVGSLQSNGQSNVQSNTLAAEHSQPAAPSADASQALHAGQDSQPSQALHASQALAQPEAAQAIAAAETPTEPVIDPVTASIMARRGLLPSGTPSVVSTAAPVGATPKKLERPEAPVKTNQPADTVPSQGAATVGLKPLMPTSPASAVAVTEKPVTPRDPKDIPPWESPNDVGMSNTSESQEAATLQAQQQAVEQPAGASIAQNLQPASKQTASTQTANTHHAELATDEVDPSELNDEADEVAATAVISATSAQHTINARSFDESELEALSEESPDSVAEQQAADVTWQASIEVETAKPIRHALLDSLPVQDNTDFASEQVVELPQLVDAGPLTFNGYIDAQNFALRTASQVDAWAARIDSLKIGGLMRLFLLHSAAELAGNRLHLTVASSQRHLDSERNRAQLAQVLSASFEQELQINIEFAEQVPASPQALQGRIDEARRIYVEQVLKQDTFVQQLTQHFAAEWQSDSLAVN